MGNHNHSGNHRGGVFHFARISGEAAPERPVRYRVYAVVAGVGPVLFGEAPDGESAFVLARQVEPRQDQRVTAIRIDQLGVGNWEFQGEMPKRSPRPPRPTSKRPPLQGGIKTQGRHAFWGSFGSQSDER